MAFNAASTSGSAAPTPVAPPPSAQGVASPTPSRPTGDDILAAVDNDPVLSKAPNQAPEKPAKKQKQVTSKLIDPAVNTTAPDNVSPDIAALLERELNPEPQGDELDQLATEGDEAEPSDRSENRFKVLVDRAKQAETRLMEVEQASNARFEQFQGQVGQVVNELRQQNMYLRGQLETLVTGSRQREPERELSPEEQALEHVSKHTLERLNPQLRQAVEPLMQRIQELEQRDEQRVQEARTRENTSRYRGDAQTAAREVLLKGFRQEDLTPDLQAEAEEDVLAMAWAKRKPMAEAARIVRQRTMRRALAYIRAANAPDVSKQQAGQEAPPVTPTARGHASSQVADPTPEQLAKDGRFSSILDWMFAGSPSLR